MRTTAPVYWGFDGQQRPYLLNEENERMVLFTDIGMVACEAWICDDNHVHVGSAHGVVGGYPIAIAWLDGHQVPRGLSAVH